MGKSRKRTVINPAKHPEAYPEHLPEFSSADEAGDFFDRHSAAPYLDEMEDVTEQVQVHRKSTKSRKSAPAVASS